MERPEAWRKADALPGAPRWARLPERRPFHGVRLAADVDPDDPLIRARAAGLVLPKQGALGSWAAAVLLGVPATWLDGRTSRGELMDVAVVIPPPRRVRARRGFSVVQAHLDPGDVVRVDGLPVTSGVRTTFDLLRHAPDLRRAVACGDGCLRWRLTTREALEAYMRERPGWRGVGLARRALPLLDDRAESPMESELRVVWIGSGLGVPIPQRTILDEWGVFVARVDLLDVKAGVVGEYQGIWHREGRRPWSDTNRARRLDGLGIEVVDFWSVDLAVEGQAVAALRTGYARAGRRDPAQRTYLILR